MRVWSLNIFTYIHSVYTECTVNIYYSINFFLRKVFKLIRTVQFVDREKLKRISNYICIYVHGPYTFRISHKSSKVQDKVERGSVRICFLLLASNKVAKRTVRLIALISLTFIAYQGDLHPNLDH